MMAEESELESNKSSLFESLGSLVGMLTGGPVGALVGGIGGALLSGKSGEDAFRSGIGSFFQGATMGAPGLALNALGGAGGSAGNIGQGIMGAISDPRALQLAAMSSGAPPLAQAMMMGLAAPQGQDGKDPGPLSRLLEGYMMDKLDRQRRPRFDTLMTDLEQEQFRTGERNPSFQGVAAPGTPVVSYRPKMAMGGYIEGPGTGTSDSIPAAIYQNGGRVQEAALSDGEFVMTEAAVKGAGNGNRDLGAARMYQMMDQFERRA
tara:strand:+ start:1755 stop:2543 length:789 start_codon:yes stop_codon:yes gene_type:complete